MASERNRERYQFCQQMQRLQIFENVARLGRNDDHVEVVDRLVQIAHVGRLDERVLRVGRQQLRKRRQQTLYSNARQIDKLSRQQNCVRNCRN